MAINWQYYHWHLEPSAVCAVKCPRCPRTEYPDTPWLNYNMDLEFIKKFFTPEMLQTKVKRITMCGDVGDPIYCKEFIEICRYIKEHNPKIHLFIITNGSHKKPEWWSELASVLDARDTINFSIDGYDNETNNMYRVNSKFDSIINGIRAVREVNKEVFLSWAVIVFSFNQDHLDKIKNHAISLEMDSVQITKSTKFGSKYGTQYGAETDSLEPRPEWISSSHRYERSEINISNRIQDNIDYMQTNQIMFDKVKKEYENQPIVPLCEIGNRGVYVNAEGVVFPCSWLSFPYNDLTYKNKTINWKDTFFAMYREKMNIRNRPFEDIINDPLWNKCSSGWKDESKTWVECGMKCNQSIVDQEYAVGWLTN
jgi:wyosine [tRNA(Phe)-imidazoG37] synthetase (radical SAM superfamily)